MSMSLASESCIFFLRLPTAIVTILPFPYPHITGYVYRRHVCTIFVRHVTIWRPYISVNRVGTSNIVCLH